MNLKKISKIKKWILIVFTYCYSMMNTVLVWAVDDGGSGSIESSTLYTGTKTLVNDAITALTGLVALVATVIAVKNSIAWNTADVDEKPKHKKAVINSVVIGVVGLTIGGLITVILSYYGG